MKLNWHSFLALAAGVIVPVVAMATPAIQSVAAANPIATAAVALGLVLWNHYVAPLAGPHSNFLPPTTGGK